MKATTFAKRMVTRVIVVLLLAAARMLKWGLSTKTEWELSQ